MSETPEEPIKSRKNDNPVIEVYKGIPIRKYNTVWIRVSASEKKKFIDLRVNFGMSERDAIEQKSMLCPCNDSIILKSPYAKGN
jgi:hypothetical protein